MQHLEKIPSTIAVVDTGKGYSPVFLDEILSSSKKYPILSLKKMR